MKSATLLLIAVVLVAATVASAADITTLVQGKCRRQVREEEEKLEHCQQYMRSAVRGGEEVELAAATCGGIGCGSGNEECCARECCNALQRMDDDCACQTVKALAQQAAAAAATRRSLGTRAAARHLANRCGITQQCDVRAVFV